MDKDTARTLNSLTTRFYERFGASFGSTRSAPWDGWQRLALELEQAGMTAKGQVLTVLDVGAGNGRFERFLAERFAQVKWRFLVVDACAPEAFGADASLFDAVYTRDIIAAALDGAGGEGEAGGESGAHGEGGEGILPADAQADLVVAFGLMHHVPTAAAREALLHACMRATAPGGFFAVSFWQFMHDERLAAKAARDTETRLAYLASQDTPLALDTHDYLLGWQDATPAAHATRYCHHFAEDEIATLLTFAETCGATPRARWSADGHTAALNSYVLLHKSCAGGIIATQQRNGVQ